jgi:predicted transcriptional regulator of viral defense system
MHYVSSKASVKNPFRRQEVLFKQRGGTLRMSEALRLGISRKTLYAMRDAGVVEPLSRGLFRLTSLDPLGNPDLVAVAARVPHGVICLISALAYHELTTRVPHAVDVALERGSRKSRIEHPPSHFYWFSGPAFHEGFETYQLDGISVRIYNPEKTVSDCFRYRNKIGMHVVLEALRLWRQRRPKKLDVLLRHARLRRVEKLIHPYLEGTK